MTKYVLANWKSHKSFPEAESWLEEFFRVYSLVPHLKVIVAPPAVHLAALWQIIRKQGASQISLAIQDVSSFPLGPYTGEVAAEMVRDMAEYAIVGHSERRRYFNETNQDVANKVSEATAVGIQPIVCVDQPYARAQLAAVEEASLNSCLIGYGPVEAIGIDVPQSTQGVSKAIAEIRNLSPDSTILYGGSVNTENTADYLSIEGVSGLMVGTASLDAGEFARICMIAAKVGS